MSKRETLDYSFARFESIDDFFLYNARMSVNFENSLAYSVFYEIDEVSYKEGTCVILKFTSVIHKTNCNCTIKFATILDAENEVFDLRKKFTSAAFYEGSIYPYHTFSKRSE